MKIELSGDKEAAELVSASGPLHFKASVLAMNRAMTTGRAEMVRQIAADTGLKAGDIRNELPLTRATYGTPMSRFGTGVKRIALGKFKARQTKRGATYAFGNSGRRTIASAFIATLRSGHEGLFARRGKARLPIDEKYGPSLGRVFAKFRPDVTTRIAAAFDAAFAHEVSRLSGGGGGSNV